jgi:endonuclease YncB( thermonuclease family)
MQRPRPSLALSIGILLAAGGALYVWRAPQERELTGVAEAIDGDSLRLAGEEIRLEGIDAPELQQTCRLGDRADPCGRTARAALRRLLAGGLVTCVSKERDRYGRLLARCRVRGVDVNAALVREGQAVAFGAYEREEADAKARYAGIWSSEFERPRDWRDRHPRPPH